MEMDFMAEFTEGMSRDRARQIIKGKRTKRQRPCSPFGMSTTSASASGSGNSDCLIENFTPDQSPAMSSEISTKEDEDMANCLIMLAQSVCVSPVKDEKSDQISSGQICSDQIRQKTEKLSSRRFAEMKSGFYVYECKTCNRTFPSFQALGGHRASHKKPKVNVEEKKPNSVNIPPPVMEYVEEDHEQQKAVEEDEENKASNYININNNNNNSKGKVHECSICGSEFLSGQALGGHMRKHRPAPAAVNRTVISINTDDIITNQIEKSPAGNNSLLSLDLNFPPPEFQFTAGTSQQHLVFSAPAFVDCHY